MKSIKTLIVTSEISEAVLSMLLSGTNQGNGLFSCSMTMSTSVLSPSNNSKNITQKLSKVAV